MASMRRTHNEWRQLAEKLELECKELISQLGWKQKQVEELRHAGEGIATSYDKLLAACHNLKNVKGHHNTEIAARRLFEMLP